LNGASLITILQTLPILIEDTQNINGYTMELPYLITWPNDISIYSDIGSTLFVSVFMISLRRKVHNLNWKVSFVIVTEKTSSKSHTGVMFFVIYLFYFYYNQYIISLKNISQQPIIYTPTCFDIFLSSSGSLHLRLLSYTGFPNCSCWKNIFTKLRCFPSSYISS
jgi:hypothetical protein